VDGHYEEDHPEQQDLVHESGKSAGQRFSGLSSLLLSQHLLGFFPLQQPEEQRLVDGGLDVRS